MTLLFLLACAIEPSDETPAPAAEDGLHGRVDTVGGREVLYLWGTREEMGYAEGALYCDRVAPLFKDYLLEHLVGQYSDFTYDVARTYVLAVTKFEDDDMRELEAMYRGMKDHCSDEQLTVESDFLGPETSHVLELEDLLFANAVADFGCSSFTVWGAASSTGDTIHGRNFDWAVDPQGTFLSAHMLKVYESSEEGGARWASVFVPAMAGCITCVTEEGVALTMHNVGGLDPTYEVDISPRMMAARAAIAATWGADDVVGDAEAALEARRQIVGNNLHLSFPMERGGGIGGVVFEYDGAADAPDGQVTVRWPGEDAEMTRQDAIVAANHYIKREPPATDGDSYERLVSLRTDIDAAEPNGGVLPGDGRAMLGRVENGYSGLTVHSVVIDSVGRDLQLFVAPAPDVPAPETEGLHVDLDELFGGLP